jgi:hypothetical protein
VVFCWSWHQALDFGLWPFFPFHLEITVFGIISGGFWRAESKYNMMIPPIKYICESMKWVKLAERKKGYL